MLKDWLFNRNDNDAAYKSMKLKDIKDMGMIVA
jgi:hypothetical protein